MALLVPAARQASYSANFTTARPGLTTMGTQLAGSATPHALGTITQLIAATTVEAEWIYIAIHDMAVGATVTDALLNIYIGPGGSETLFIDSLLAGWSSTLAQSGVPNRFWFPVRIPRGTRISGALRTLIASDVGTVYVCVGNSNGAHWVGSGIETLGEVTASSRGTNVTPGTTSEGAWASMGTSGRRYRYLNMRPMGNNDTSLLATTIAWDIGSGSAVLQGMEGLMFSTDGGNEFNMIWEAAGVWCDIPSGTALQLRGQSHGASVSGAQSACLYGVY